LAREVDDQVDAVVEPEVNGEDEDEDDAVVQPEPEVKGEGEDEDDAVVQPEPEVNGEDEDEDDAVVQPEPEVNGEDEDDAVVQPEPEVKGEDEEAEDDVEVEGQVQPEGQVEPEPEVEGKPEAQDKVEEAQYEGKSEDEDKANTDRMVQENLCGKYWETTTGNQGVNAFIRNLVELPLVASNQHLAEEKGVIADFMIKKLSEQSGKANELEKKLAKSVLNGTKEAAALQKEYPSVLGFGVGFQPSEKMQNLSKAWSNLNMSPSSSELPAVTLRRIGSMVDIAHVSSAGSPLQKQTAAHALTLFASPGRNYGGLGYD
jgi:hypothetical protein